MNSFNLDFAFFFQRRIGSIFLFYANPDPALYYFNAYPIPQNQI